MNLTRAEFDALYASGPDALYALFERQAAQLAALTARVQELEGRLGATARTAIARRRAMGRASRRAASGRGAVGRRAGNRGIPVRLWR